MGIKKGKWIRLECDGHFRFNCFRTEDLSTLSFTEGLKELRENGWVIRKNGYCLCPECRKYENRSDLWEFDTPQYKEE